MYGKTCTVNSVCGCCILCCFNVKSIKMCRLSKKYLLKLFTFQPLESFTFQPIESWLMYGSHTLVQIPSYLTQFPTQNDQNSTGKSLHVSHNMVYSQICHKYIHIMVGGGGVKDQTSKEIVICQNSVSPRICCEQGAAGMLRAFPVHFMPLQLNSSQCNVHSSRAATENCMKCNISLKHSLAQIIVNWPILSKK